MPGEAFTLKTDAIPYIVKSHITKIKVLPGDRGIGLRIEIESPDPEIAVDAYIGLDQE